VLDYDNLARNFVGMGGELIGRSATKVEDFSFQTSGAVGEERTRGWHASDCPPGPNNAARTERQPI